MGFFDKLGRSSGAKQQTGTGKGEYTCEMHSEVHLDKPGKCPQCGMKLVQSGKSGGNTSKGGSRHGCC